jgi:hypothetical protein
MAFAPNNAISPIESNSDFNNLTFPSPSWTFDAA